MSLECENEGAETEKSIQADKIILRKGGAMHAVVPAKLPRTSSEITPQWLNGVLRKSGFCQDSCVRKVGIDLISHGRGAVCHVLRLRLGWEENQPHLPSSIAMKIPSNIEPIAQNFWWLLQTEVNFYKQIAHYHDGFCPGLYYADMSPEAKQFVLLLEDLGKMTPGDQVHRCSMQQMEMGVRSLARFHRMWWENPALDSYPWLRRPHMPKAEKGSKNWYLPIWQSFVDKYAKIYGLSSKEIRLGDCVAAYSPLTNRLLGESHWTLAHGDYRAENLFFNPSNPDREVVAHDWQLVHIGNGSWDLAYFLLSSMSLEQRRRHEQRLINLYLSELSNDTEIKYSFEQCLRDFRISCLDIVKFFVIVVSSCIMKSTEQSDRMHEVIRELLLDSFAAALDHKADELLKE
jgi:hypothetical protein